MEIIEEKKLYKIVYAASGDRISGQEDVIYFSVDGLIDVIYALDSNREVHSIQYLGNIKILKG